MKTPQAQSITHGQETMQQEPQEKKETREGIRCCEIKEKTSLWLRDPRINSQLLFKEKYPSLDKA